ncbi:MAG: hypothetical protein JWO32_2373 [Bacteroidetes bacterium]|jgi:hypothetical protein|nr:hypothetical protein [Bacteroidota bacterium]
MIPDDLYTKEEAEEIRSAYSCWINKSAHTGHGYVDILTAIKIRQKRSPKRELKSKKRYQVQFEFAHAKKQTAYDFLINNGLYHPSGNNTINTTQTPHPPIS